MFTGSARSRMFMLFYFAVPVGSGLGFVVGSTVASYMGAWQWGIRLTAVAGIIALALLILIVDEPQRGAAEKSDDRLPSKSGSYWKDVKTLMRTPTFISCTWAYTTLIFVTGTLSWWEPTIIKHAVAWNQGLNDTELLPNYKKDQIGQIFGGITTVAGIIGVSAGTILSETLLKGQGIFRPLKTERAQPLVSGLGSLIAAPLLLLGFLFGHQDILILWVLLFFVVTFLSFNWSLNVDVLMSVVLPSMRSTAFSYFMLISHLFGDASGPYIIGAISDAIRGDVKTPKTQYISLVKASAVTVVLLCISAVLYFVTSVTLPKDQAKFRKQLGLTDCDRKETDSSSSSNEKLNRIYIDESEQV
ncbi:hypothetical protein RB195_020148 [Necator americanus]